MTNAATIEAEPVPLSKDEAGRLMVAGTRVPLDTLVAAFERGDGPEEIHEQFPTVSLGDIYAVLTYCVRHRDAVNSYLAERRRKRAVLRSEVEERFPRRLFAQGCWRDVVDDAPVPGRRELNRRVATGLRRRPRAAGRRGSLRLRSPE